MSWKSFQWKATYPKVQNIGLALHLQSKEAYHQEEQKVQKSSHQSNSSAWPLQHRLQTFPPGKKTNNDLDNFLEVLTAAHP